MSKIEKDALWNAFILWKQARMPKAKEDDAFEVFAIEQILKDRDPSDEEIQSGNIGGGGDGGIDGYYFYIDRNLVRGQGFSPVASMSAELVLIQATRSPGFGEGKIDKLEKFCHYLLDWEDVNQYTNLRQSAKDGIMRFRENYEKLLSHHHTLTVEMHYASTSEYEPSSNVLTRIDLLKNYIQKQLSLAQINFTPWGCAKLLGAVREFPNKKLNLVKVKNFEMPDESVVCLCTVAAYAEFLDDGKGQPRTWMMEPNVRDYQGTNPVNRQIRETLNKSSWTEDFWWLNNGVTILADSCTVTGDKVTIENPELVNGLQSSYEIFNARQNPSLKDRHVLVKVIVAKEERSKNAIIKATNSQTTVSRVSLNATEPIQFDIEDRLRREGLYYDRRKGKYKLQKKPIKDIVSITALGQSIIAAFLQRPSDSRGRPETVLNDEKILPSIFSLDYDLDFYAACILIDRKCSDFIQGSDIADEWKVDLRYYVTMLAASSICDTAMPTASELAAIMPQIATKLSDKILQWCLDTARHHYVELGSTDKVAKGREMEDNIKKELAERHGLV